MGARSSGVFCDRARSWAALAPDRELSELERKLLDRHLDACGDCSAFAAEVAATTELIRADDLVPLARPVPIPSWHRHRVLPVRFGSVGAAAAVALMAIGIAARAPLPMTGAESRASQLPQVTDYANNAKREVAQIHALRRVYVTPENVLRLRPAKQPGTLPA